MKYLPFLILAAFSCSSAILFAEGEAPQRQKKGAHRQKGASKDHFAHLVQRLQLDNEQKAAARNLMEKSKKSQAAYIAEMKGLEEKTKKLFENPEVNEQQILDAGRKSGEIRARLRLLKQTFFSSLKPLLTEEQLVAFEKMKEKMKEMRRHKEGQARKAQGGRGEKGERLGSSCHKGGSDMKKRHAQKQMGEGEAAPRRKRRDKDSENLIPEENEI